MLGEKDESLGGSRGTLGKFHNKAQHGIKQPPLH